MIDAANDLLLTRVLNAPRQKIWRCWSEPDLLKQWFCPRPWYVSDVRMELRPGGPFVTVLNGPEGESFENKGVFLEIVPEEGLVFTDAFEPGWRPAGKPFFVGRITMADAGEGRTDYQALAMHWTAESRDEHEEMGFYSGWGLAADQLEALAQTL
ncbi:MAG TPA: SRPBCC family protein [Paracoccus sp. (in: a-proteobacteria)]|uniref:SRPBCC family protein n=1 Tax=Paracoccus sp. TaxID=267 RepID=UPI002B9DF46D|nr:SRPBCC family protein [Paracoccus sp. (in: a-proteobacteria)]HWL56495.1 SRPBCC family protein [Paracoccus sp. (in: a-proteobacteria)]